MRFLKKYWVQLVIILIAIPYLVVQSREVGDFRILLRGAEYLRRGVSPYGIVMPIHGRGTDMLIYSPFVAFVMLPLTYLPEFIPAFIFNLFNIFLLFRIWAIISTWLEINKLYMGEQKWWYVLTILLILRFILHNFENTQQNILVLYCSLEGLYQIFLRSKNTGALLLALGICIKLLPLVFLPYLVYRRKSLAALITIAFSAVLLFLPAIWFGAGFEIDLLRGWWTAINPTLDKYNAGQNVGYLFQSIPSLISVYFSDCSYQGLSVNIMNLDKQQLFWIISISRVILVLPVFYFLQVTDSSHKEQKKIFTFWEISYLFLIIPLIFPNQGKHAFTNLLPSFAYIIYYLLSINRTMSSSGKRERMILLTCLSLVVIFTSFTADIFWGFEIGRYFQFMRFITIGTIVFVPVVAFFSPRRLLSVESRK